MTVRFLEAARDELREAVRYYDGQRPGLGAEFAAEVRSTVGRIAKLPDGWQLLSGNTRRCRTKRFPYGIIYQAAVDELLIVAVAHLRREPDYWKDRL